MTPEEFVREAERRQIYAMSCRLHLDAAALETVHRHGILVLLFRVDLADSDPQRRIDVSGTLTAQHVTNTIPSELPRAAAEGRVHDPAAEPFTRLAHGALMETEQDARHLGQHGRIPLVLGVCRVAQLEA